MSVAFALATCAPGFEAALKDDVARARPDYRLALSRPGVVTWKCEAPPLDGELAPSPYARTWARSLGKGAAALVDAPAGVARVVARDPDADGAAAAVAAAIEELRATGRTVGEPALHEPALLVVTSPGEPYLVAHYRRARWDGTVTAAEVPPEAPSRAYAKLEEAIAWAGLPVGAGQVAVEIGAAPGGAAYALARRGVTVHAVDPGDLDPRVLAFRGPGGAQVHHLRETLAGVRWEQLPRAVDWLLVDVNLAAPVAVHGVARFVPAWKRSLRGAVITLKMNDQAVRRTLPTLLHRLTTAGFAEVHAIHLPANRAEVCAVALRPPR